MAGLDDDVKNRNKSDSDSDDTSSGRKTIFENGYQQPVETPYMENAVEELGQVCCCLIIQCRINFAQYLLLLRLSFSALTLLVG